MTLKNLVENKQLMELDRHSRDTYLAQTFSITPEEFAYIRTDSKKRDIMGRVLRAVKILHQRLMDAGTPQDVISAQFTTTTLAALVDDGTYSNGKFRQLCTVVSRSIMRRYENLSKEENIPFIQLLRDECGVYQGNLHFAMKRWPEIKVSNYDWLKDVRLPLKVGQLEASLLGVYFARSSLYKNTELGAPDRMEIWGENTDFDFFNNVVRPLIKQVHNQDVEVCNGSNKNVLPAGWSYDIPGILFSSQAVATWLTQHFGMSCPRENVTIPLEQLADTEQQVGFFKGILAADGRPYVYEDRSRLQITKEDISYIVGVRQLSQQLGFSPSLQKPRGKGIKWLLDFSESAMVDMIQRGLFINPHHQYAVQPLSKRIDDATSKEYAVNPQ